MNRSEGRQLGLRLKEQALDGLEGRDWMKKARKAAFLMLKGLPPFCSRYNWVTIDDIQYVVGPPPSPNMAGGVFRKGFVLVGHTTSCKPEGHGNRIGKWRLG